MNTAPIDNQTEEAMRRHGAAHGSATGLDAKWDEWYRKLKGELYISSMSIAERIAYVKDAKSPNKQLSDSDDTK